MRVKLDDLPPSVRARVAAVMDAQDRARARAATAAPTIPAAAPPPKKPRGPRAIRTRCGAGHSHASALEARVCDRLTAEVAATPGARLYQQVGIALVNVAPVGTGRPLRFTVDFVFAGPGVPTRYIEAKGRWRSRDYVVRRCAAEALLGVPVEEVSG